MDPMDLIRDRFSQDCTIETVLHLLMAHFELRKRHRLRSTRTLRLWKNIANERVQIRFFHIRRLNCQVTVK